MSEVTGAPPSPPSQHSGGERAGPTRVSGARQKQEETSTGQQQPGHDRSSAAEQEAAKTRFEPAVAVSPTLLHITPGTELRGEISHLDGEGRPVLETAIAAFALEPDAGLKAADRVVIKIDNVDRESRGQLLEKNGQRLEAVIEVRLTLTTLHLTPDAAPGPAPEPQERIRAPDIAYPATARPAPAGEGPFLTDQATAFAAAGKAPLTTGTQTAGLVRGFAQALANLSDKTFSALASTIVSSDKATATEPPPAIPGAPGTAASPFGQPASIASAPIARGMAVPGQHIQARLVIGTPESIGDPRLAGLVPGSAVILTVLGAGADKASLGHEPVLSGIVTTAEAAAGISSNPLQIDAPLTPAEPISPAATTANVASANVTSANVTSANAVQQENQATGVQGGAQSSPPISGGEGLQYFAFDGGSFVFHRQTRLPVGTQLTVALTPVPDTTAEASATALRAAPKSSAPTASTTGNPTKPAHGGTATDGSTATSIQQSTQPQTPMPLSILPQQQPLQPLPPLPPLIGYQEAWPIMDELFAAAQAMDPASRGMVNARVPSPGGNLPNSLLFFLTAVGMGQPAKWLGSRASQALEAWKGGHLLKQLKGEFTRLGRISRDVPGSDWRPFLIPLQTETGGQAIVILTRPHHDDQRQSDGQKGESGDDEKLGKNQRFLLEVTLSRLGRLQLDGLMRPGRLDLVVRGGKALSPGLRDELRSIFIHAIDEAAIEGSLGFEPLDLSPVNVRDVLARALPEDHDAHLTA